MTISIDRSIMNAGKRPPSTFQSQRQNRRTLVELRETPGEPMTLVQLADRLGLRRKSITGAIDVARKANGAYTTDGDWTRYQFRGGPSVEFRIIGQERITRQAGGSEITRRKTSPYAYRCQWRPRCAADASPGRSTSPQATGPHESRSRFEKTAAGPVNPNIIGAAAPITHGERPTPESIASDAPDHELRNARNGVNQSFNGFRAEGQRMRRRSRKVLAA